MSVSCCHSARFRLSVRTPEHFLRLPADSLKSIVDGFRALSEQIRDLPVICTHKMKIQNISLQLAQIIIELFHKRLCIFLSEIQSLRVCLLLRAISE